MKRLTITDSTIRDDVRCAHCRQEVLGYGSIGNRRAVCHSPIRDCYRLVTVWHHETPCECCADLAMLQPRAIEDAS